jgi:hypothetical protein
MSNHAPTRRALAAALLTTVAAAAHAGGPQYGPWEDTHAVDFVNTATAAEGCPIESHDGLHLYFASNRVAPGAQGKLDIYRADRPTKRDNWGMAENLAAPVNSAEFDFCPTPVGKWLFFVSSADTETDDDPANDDCLTGPPAPPPPGGPSPGDIFLSDETRDGWQAPLHLGCLPYGPNTPGAEFSPSLVTTRAGTFLYFSSNGYPDSQGQDIYASRVIFGFVLPGRRVAELSTPYDDRMPNVRSDGLEIVFSSDRPGGAGAQDVYVATRRKPSDHWSAPRRIHDASINTPASETRASLSGDGTRLYFGRKLDLNDPGDIYLSTRRRRHHDHD